MYGVLKQLLFAAPLVSMCGPRHGAGSRQDGATGPVARLRASITPVPVYQCVRRQPHSCCLRCGTLLHRSNSPHTGNIHSSSSRTSELEEHQQQYQQQLQCKKETADMVGNDALQQQIGESRASAQGTPPTPATSTRIVLARDWPAHVHAQTGRHGRH